MPNNSQFIQQFKPTKVGLITKEVKIENGHQALQRNFLFKISGIRELVTKRENGRDNMESYFLLLSCLWEWFRLIDSNL